MKNDKKLEKRFIKIFLPKNPRQTNSVGGYFNGSVD